MAKKDFKGAIGDINSLFLSGAEEPAQDPARQEAARPAAPANTRWQEIRQETKSDRLQLLIRPSTNKALAKEARRRRISKNELINQILEAHTKGAE